MFKSAIPTSTHTIQPYVIWSETDPHKIIMSLMYRILSKKLSQAVAIKICHLVEIRIEMSKIAEGDEYLDYIHETLEWATSLEHFVRWK